MKDKWWKFTQQLGPITWLILVCITVGQITSYWMIKNLSQKLVEQTMVNMPSVRNMGLIDMMHDAIRSAVLATWLAAKENDKATVQASKKELEEFVANLDIYIKNITDLTISDDTRKLIGPVLKDVDTYSTLAHQIVSELEKENFSDAKILMTQFSEQFELLEKGLGDLGDQIEQRAENDKNASLESIKNFQIVVILLFLFSCIIALFNAKIVAKLIRELKISVSKLLQETAQIENTSSTLEMTSIKVASTTNQQASAVQETASTMNELTAMVEKTDQNCKELNQSALQGRASANKGKNAIVKMGQAMNEVLNGQKKIFDNIDEGNKRIEEIVKVIGDIGDKTKIINDIVFQTKLLSFNASVEAARAGEYGKGFAVVAEEVGNLAQLSGGAAKEISEMLAQGIQRVDTIIKENKEKLDRFLSEEEVVVKNSISVVNDVEKTLEEIIKQNEEVNSKIQDIATAISEQTNGINEINKSIHLLDDSTRTNAEVAQSTSKESNNLKNRSNELLYLVKSINTVVTGKEIKNTSNKFVA